MINLTLTYVGRKPRTSASGKPYTSLSIKAKEYGDKWLSGFDSNETKNWNIGDVVEVEVVQKGEYLNFTVPKKEKTAPSSLVGLDQVIIMLTRMEERQIRILNKIDESDHMPNFDRADLDEDGFQIPA